MNINRLVLVLTFFSVSLVQAQNKYWILFKDKKDDSTSNYVSAECLANRKKFNLPVHQYTDVPVTAAYVKQVAALGVKLANQSRWLNGVTGYVTGSQIEKLKALPFVKEVFPVNTNIHVASANLDMKPAIYSDPLKQIHANVITENNLTGKGVTIGVTDAGFWGANNDVYLLHLFTDRSIKGQRDFINLDRKDLIVEPATDSDQHGRWVMERICGFDEERKKEEGFAINSNFYFARTENGEREYRGEEDNWVAAVEWLDSLGVRLVNTSLGYSTKMDNPLDNYKLHDMNGKTTVITRAADIASNQKGMFLVVSAGNEGENQNWQIISAPADAQGVLSIGATRERNCERIGYSSIGPDFLTYLKPNVSCFSLGGTSFSAPVITGFVACLMEKAPNLNNKQLKMIVEKSANLYPYGNNYIGYGYPIAERALQLLADSTHDFGVAASMEIKGKKTTIKCDKFRTDEAVLFHKKNDFVVLSQEVVTVKKGKIKLKRKPEEVRTTISFEDEGVIEVIWR